nr:MAK10-like protein [Tanacetum cinerariifolium]
MEDENPIRTLGDYSKPSHEGYRNTIEIPVGNNVVPLRSDTILLVQNGWSFHGLWYEDPNQHLKDFLKLVDSLDLDSENRERTRLRVFSFSLRDQASNWLERIPAGSITTWEDLTTRFLAQFFPSGRTLERPKGFAKPVKAIALPQDVPSTFDRRLIKLENEVQHLMEAYLALTQPTQVNKITTSCEMYSGPHDEAGGCPSNLKIPCNIRHVHVEKAYIDPNSPLNIMTRMMYNWIMRRKLDPRENSNSGVSNFIGRINEMHVFIGNFTYIVDFMIVEDISSIIDPRLSQVVLGKPFVEMSNTTHYSPEGVVRFINGT